MEEINGDTKLSAGQRLRYFWDNILRNLSDGGGGKLITHYRIPGDFDKGSLGSPVRVVTEAFLLQRVPEMFPPGTVRVLVVGCGSGSLSDKLADVGYVGDYVGVDIDNRFLENTSHPQAFTRRFVQTDAHAFCDPAPYDLVVSICALEHIPNDDRLVSNLEGMVGETGLQVHFLPSGWALFLYLWHGFRQYTAGRIARQPTTQNMSIYSLGGLPSFLVHFIFITVAEAVLKVQLRRHWPDFYRWCRNGAMRMDRFMPFVPIGYVMCLSGKDGER